MQQDESLATYAPKIRKDDARIDWTLPADEVVRRIRAYNPFPGAFCFLPPQETRLKIWRASVAEGGAEPGTVLGFDRNAIVVACGENAVRLEELQLPGKRRAPAHEFIGQADFGGQRLD